MPYRAEYQQHLAAQLSGWEASIETLRASAIHASADARITFDNEMDKLEASHRAARKTLAAFARESGEIWADMRVATERAWAEMDKAMEHTAARFT